MTKLYDTTRPCIDTSGNYHVVTDIYVLHNYEQDPAKFAATYESFKQGGDLEDNHGYRQTPVKGIPTFISEYGRRQTYGDCPKGHRSVPYIGSGIPPW